jgi:D-glucuronyl C5-epimerase-like protein
MQDLGRAELWQESLERSRARREQARREARAKRSKMPVLRTAMALAAAAVVVSLGLLAVRRADRVPVRARDRPAIANPDRELAGLLGQRAVSATSSTSYLRSLRAAMRTETQLSGTGAAELDAVITNVTSIAARGPLTPSQLRVLSLTLDRNREWWATGRLLSPHQQVEFRGSRLVWEHYPGQGIELQEQGSFSTADALCKAGPSHYPACTELLSELIPLATNRSGSLAWEYYFNFGGGEPPWTSAISQGTALQAFADAYKATKNSLYLAVGERALALFTVAPPSGVAVKTLLGARYVEYSFDPASADQVLNAFLKSLIGLDDFAQTSKSRLAARLFASGNAEAQAELPQYDTGSWSLYKPGVEDTLAYHQLVIGLLQQLCAMTRASVYCTTASHFLSYLKTAPIR